MLVRDLRRLCLIIGPFLVFFFITLTIWGFPSFAGEKVTSIPGDTFPSDNNNNKVPYHGSSSSSKDGSIKSSPSAAANGGIAPGLFPSEKEGNDGKEGESTHQTIHSVSTKNGSYFRIEFAKDTAAFNPNIIPHPTRPGVFVVVAQKWHGPGKPSPSPPSPHSSSSAETDTNHPAAGSSGGKTKSQHVPVTMQSELSCLATFNPKTANVLSCLPEQPPLPLPIAATPGNNCVGPFLGVLSFSVGPRDARVFYGGDGKPYTIFGSNSQFTCFGMWMQDFRVLVEWWGKEVGVFGSAEGWRVAGELQRPALPAVEGGSGEVGNGNGELKGKKGEEDGHGEGKNLKEEEDEDEEKPKIPAGWGEIEKNWFVFWAPPLSSPDSSSSSSSSSSSLSSPSSSSHHQPQSSSAQLQTYIHYDFFPHRSFALLHSDGSATPVSSSSISAANDEKCLSHYLPPLPPSEPVSIHQSTNSLRLTLCYRSDPSCIPTESNTFLLTIIQHKRFYHFHSEYEPYVVLFSQKAPSFEVFGVSKKPVWIEGRKKWGKGEWHAEGQGRGGGEERTEMFYVTSVNWRDYHGEDDGGNGAGYHGYLDDVLIIGFGVEDKESGGIDVLAGELVTGVGLCEEVVGKGDVTMGGRDDGRW
ncbi:hypothetical protein QBC45DRAFT_416448 [Copromyces sp. CBS 386.78]|nr:hypothetical protein QBC45DRAFT_416448 [Copromyces sp. CBS 386.78]